MEKNLGGGDVPYEFAVYTRKRFAIMIIIGGLLCSAYGCNNTKRVSQDEDTSIKSRTQNTYETEQEEAGEPVASEEAVTLHWLLYIWNTEKTRRLIQS